MTAPVGVGIIGMGFMGQTHARAYAAAARTGAPCVLRAVCDPNAERRAGRAAHAGNIAAADRDPPFDPDAVRGYADPDELLADGSIDLVSVCTHTDSHVDLAIRAIDAGRHVLVEKPVALSSPEVERLIAHARRSDRLCVPAMCMRHWPGWADLKRLVASGEHGSVRHARFERLGSAPAWADFYADPDRCGGAIFDLHVHDADLALWLFGPPESVHSVGDARHVSTHMRYPGGPAVATEGGWLSAGFPFRMGFTVEFERAVAAFDSSRDPAMTLHTSDGPRPVPLPAHTGYDAQARAMVNAVVTADASGLPSLDDALAVTRLIEAERRSAAEGRAIAYPG